MGDQLNVQQLEAVAYTQGPLLLIAGPGSGKTRVITHRIAHIITAGLARPSAIIAVTFTNKAAGEMRKRSLALLADEPLDSVPIISTFHSFGVRLLRRSGGPLAQIRPGFTTKFHVFDPAASIMVIKDCYDSLRIDDNFISPKDAQGKISKAKGKGQTPSELLELARDKWQNTLARLFDAYEGALRRENALDFDDLLGETVRLLHHDDSTRGYWNERLEYIMVDEFQDTNSIQYDLIRLLTYRQQNVCVVGDDDQGIYSWRGATVENIHRFKRDYKEVKLIRLEQNYRSTKNIVTASRTVIERNKIREPKELWTASGPGEDVCVYEAYDADGEAQYITDFIMRFQSIYPGRHAAVLYRSNRQSRKIESAMRACGLKYRVVRGLSFFQRAEIKDVMAYLKLATGNCDSINLLRIINKPARGMTKKIIEEVKRLAQEKDISLLDAIERMAGNAITVFRNLIADLVAAASTSTSLPELIDFIVKQTKYKAMLEKTSTKDPEDGQSRLENVQELIEAAAAAEERGETVEDFIDYMSLASDADAYDESALVSLMTLHTAKGLEFPFVVICGMVAGVFPHPNAESLEEERRLFYVGLTRARGLLMLTHYAHGSGYGFCGGPSQFLRELPKNLMRDLNEPLGAVKHG